MSSNLTVRCCQLVHNRHTLHPFPSILQQFLHVSALISALILHPSLVRHNLPSKFPSVHLRIVSHNPGMRASRVSLLFQGSHFAGLCRSEGVGRPKLGIDRMRVSVCFCRGPSSSPPPQLVNLLKLFNRLLFAALSFPHSNFISNEWPALSFRSPP